MARIPRRRFLATTTATVIAATAWMPSWRSNAKSPASSSTQPDAFPADGIDSRILGLLLGTALGDAMGGPFEFQPVELARQLLEPTHGWKEDEVLDATSRAAAASRLHLRSYHQLRPKPESYGQWNHDAAPGTVTDDTRHKLIFLHALAKAERAHRWPLTLQDFAQAHLEWPRLPAIAQSPHAEYPALAADWLEEWLFAARWILGGRDTDRAKPPERMWTGLATCCGQMTLPPLAALYPGRPDDAYRAAHHLAFFDNGWGKDLNAALIAGLATALVTPVNPNSPRAAWETIFASIRGTDPYGYGKIRWTTRAVDRCLDLALRLAREADHRPARLYAALEREFEHTTKWEAHVPFTVIFACLALADYDALVAWQLSMEWGHDTDSYAQLLGAFLGALHGPELFRRDWRDTVTARLQADFQVDLAGEARRLSRLRRVALRHPLVEEPGGRRRTARR